MRIKICGFTQEADVRAALAAGVDLIGLNLAHGPRRLSLAEAAALARLVPPGVGVVALFVDAGEEEILAAASRLRAAAVQLHGDEPPELAERLRARIPVIKAFRIGAAADLDAVIGYPADAYLLDARVAGSVGGTGRCWNYQWLAGRELGRPWFLAGGLTPETVAEAIQRTRPWGVDAASGVEAAPGRKDAERLRAFVTAARQVQLVD
ncbi:MAG: phosphoribosylanthranilate isomerase [Planctomycetes bacterium]|nr:phosphoribosylanthranilate isomerase [Planctomycetota bacterium]